MVVFDRLFFIWGTKKSGRWSRKTGGRLITVTIVRKFAGADSALVVLDEWLPHRSGHPNRFGGNALS